MAESNADAKVEVVMTVASHNVPRGKKVKVDRKTAERLIANNQARKA